MIDCENKYEQNFYMWTLQIEIFDSLPYINLVEEFDICLLIFGKIIFVFSW